MSSAEHFTRKAGNSIFSRDESEDRRRTNNGLISLQTFLNANKPPPQKGGGFRLSKKSSLCWAFSIFYDIIIMGDEKCLNEEKWSEEFMKL